MLSFLLALISCSEKDTVVQPDVTAPDTTAPIVWSREQSPHTITDTFVVEEVDSLIIEPGTIVRFQSETPLIVKGTLLSIGTSSDSIFLTSIDSGYWGGIHFLGSSDSSKMEYTAATNCWHQVLYIEDTSPVISHCRLEHTTTYSERCCNIIYCSGTAYPLIENCLIIDYPGYRGCGVLCWPPANPRLVQNDIVGRRPSDQSCVKMGGFLVGNYLAVWDYTGIEWVVTPDKSLGYPVDEIGDGVCTTISTDTLCLFYDVDGVTEPRGMPQYIFW
jgi:hypothetical protein